MHQPSDSGEHVTPISDHPAVLPGLQLSELFYTEVVQPILAAEFPGLPYSAALLGPGSEILGYDTARSTDHEWGPRLLLFVTEPDYEASAALMHAVMRAQLPPVFRGYSTHFGAPDVEGVQVPEAHHAGPVEHKVLVSTPARFCLEHLGLDPLRGLSVPDWLIMPQQTLLELTAGRVYHDGLGTLAALRARLAWYPPDVWRFLLASQWQRISQQEPFVGRTGEVGDEVGSQLIASTLVRDLMRLVFLVERRYAPYSKWFGTAFTRLDAAASLAPSLAGALRATTWPEREHHLGAACETVARLHNALGITAPLPDTVSLFHSRPFRVIHGDQFANAIAATITDDEVRRLLHHRGLIGGIDQITDNVDILTQPQARAAFRALYDAPR